MFAMYVINTPNSIFVPWNIIKGFLDENTIKKIIFSKTNCSDTLLNHTNIE